MDQGKDQSIADYHIINKQFGVRHIRAMVGNNAKTQTGQFKGFVKMHSLMFDKEMLVVCYYLDILNITVKRCCQAAFGSKGDMHNAHIQQMHHKIA